MVRIISERRSWKWSAGGTGKYPSFGRILYPRFGPFVRTRVPVPFDRVHLVEGVALVLGVAHVVEDEELGLGPEVTRVGEPGGAEVRLGLAGHVAGVTRVGLERHRVAHEAVDVEGAVLAEGVDDRRVGVGHEEHVRLLDLLEAPDRRPVEPEALLEDVLGERVGGDREVLHEAGQVDEPDVDDLDALVLHQAEHFRRGPLLHGSSLVVGVLLGPVAALSTARRAVRLGSAAAAPWWWLTRRLTSPRLPTLRAALRPGLTAGLDAQPATAGISVAVARL